MTEISDYRLLAVCAYYIPMTELQGPSCFFVHRIASQVESQPTYLAPKYKGTRYDREYVSS